MASSSDSSAESWKNWTCTVCSTVNKATVCKLASIPALRCRGSLGGVACNISSTVSHKWKITDITFTRPGNKQIIKMHLPIYNQGQEGTCSCYSCVFVVLLMWKLQYGWTLHTAHTVEPAMRQLINLLPGVTRDGVFVPNVIDDGVIVSKVLNLIVDQGIPTKAGCLPFDPRRNIRIKSYTRLNHSDVEHLTRLIADGHPLVGVIPSGRLFGLNTCEEPYFAPEPIWDNSGIMETHAVALIGSGLGYKAVDGNNPGHETFFPARNSYGHEAHGSISNGQHFRGKPVGGDFIIWASDLIEVYRVDIVDVDKYLPPKKP